MSNVESSFIRVADIKDVPEGAYRLGEALAESVHVRRSISLPLALLQKGREDNGRLLRLVASDIPGKGAALVRFKKKK